MQQIDMERVRRESMRWLILLTLNNARPIGAFEHLVLSVVRWSCAKRSITCSIAKWLMSTRNRTAAGIAT
jgi:hypothetical protein